MQRRVFMFLGLLLATSAMANASTLSLSGSGELLPETAGQVITLVLNGSDTYTHGNFFGQVASGGPSVQTIFGASAGSIPAGSLAGSLWGSAGIGSIGTEPNFSFSTTNFVPQSSSGLYATLTVSTVGVAPGSYLVSLDGTELFNGLNEDFDPIPSLNFVAQPFTLTIVPEPSSIVMGLMAAAGMAAVVIRRRRTA
jgi:hypothetical protein